MSEQTVSPITSRRVPIAIVIGLTILSGVAHGYLDGRWSRDVDLKAIGQRLQDLPEKCGDWVLIEKSELDTNAAELLRCYGSTVRLYHNEKLDATVNVALLFGPRGPIAVHTPEICYSSVGTKQVGKTRAQTISTKNAEHQLWQVQFSQAPDPEPSLDVWYAWSNGGTWQASKNPRFWPTQSLYKIQVAGSIGNVSQRPCEDFLQAIMPHVEGLLQ